MDLMIGFVQGWLCIYFGGCCKVPLGKHLWYFYCVYDLKGLICEKFWFPGVSCFVGGFVIL